MSQPNYRVQMSFDGERQVFIARAPELEHCFGEGPTRAEALARVEDEIAAQIQNIAAHGSLPPSAVDEESWSGDLAVKVSRTLHRDLAWQARSEGVEMDQLVGELLGASLEARRSSRPGRAGNRAHVDHAPGDNIGNSIGNDRGARSRGNFGGRSTAMLDDRATFIEYVRGLEGGGHPGPAGGPGRGGMDNGRRRRRRGGGPGGPGGTGGPGRGPNGPNGNGVGNKV